MIKSMKKYVAQKKRKREGSFFEVAKKNIVKGCGPKESLAANIDKILYGKE